MDDRTQNNTLLAEAKRLSEEVLKQIASPTPQASVYNRCLESLSRLQKKTWDATDVKWQEILQAAQSETDRLRIRCEELEAQLDDAKKFSGQDTGPIVGLRSDWRKKVYALEQRLKRAVKGHELIVRYSPLCDCGSKRAFNIAQGVLSDLTTTPEIS